MNCSKLNLQLPLCWHVGQRLLKENLDEGRAAYGKRILVTVSQQLEAEFGDGFSYSALTRMVRFAESMTDEAIVATLSQQLSTESGGGFTPRGFDSSIQFARAFADKAIFSTPSTQSGRSHDMTLPGLDARSIRVSETLTELPPLKLLQARLHQAIEHAREHAARLIGKGRT